jgi:hypothetical protein
MSRLTRGEGLSEDIEFSWFPLTQSWDVGCDARSEVVVALRNRTELALWRSDGGFRKVAFEEKSEGPIVRFARSAVSGLLAMDLSSLNGRRSLRVIEAASGRVLSRLDLEEEPAAWREEVLMTDGLLLVAGMVGGSQLRVFTVDLETGLVGDALEVGPAVIGGHSPLWLGEASTGDTSVLWASRRFDGEVYYRSARLSITQKPGAD